jgi:hypothetical protein
VKTLRRDGHRLYDFRHPFGNGSGSSGGFSFSIVDEAWQLWDPHKYVEKLYSDPRIEAAFVLDMAGLRWADTLVQIHPCGASANLGLGWSIASGKNTYVLLDSANFRPDLDIASCAV